MPTVDCKMIRRQQEAHRKGIAQAYWALRIRKLRRLAAGFTLIEMLTVIAIIAILAGILIPTIGAVMRKAKMAKARSEIAGLTMAISSYILSFGAPPPDCTGAFADPDQPDVANPSAWSDVFDATHAPFHEMDTPNECLLWFLTRTYTKSQDSSAVAGIPWAASGGWTTAPEDANTVYARVNWEPSLDVPAKSRKDYDEDGFYEFLDPWGRPYLYRAYYNTSSEALHNQNKGFDLYSLGPNGVTRGAAQPTVSGAPSPWKPFISAAERAKLSDIWGMADAGNDLPADRNGNSGIADEKDRDDICNW